MDWHAKNRSEDGVLRILEDYRAMKHIENIWLKKWVSSNYLVWPIVIFNYSIPPCMSFKKEYLMSTLLVLRSHQVKNIDIYLEPLIDELQ